MSVHQYVGERRQSTPGVYFEDVAPRGVRDFRTGVPAFFGFARPARTGSRVPPHDFDPRELTVWGQFGELFEETPEWGFLSDAVRGFFENGGRQCFVIPLPFPGEGRTPEAFSRRSMDKAWDALESGDDVDLICFPDLVLAGEQMLELQREVLQQCTGKTGRFAILDSPPETSARGRAASAADLGKLEEHWKALLSLRAETMPPGEGALYFPWLRARRSTHSWVPPCGHVAGIYARTDSTVGVHKAPANEVVEGVVDLELRLADGDQGRLNEVGINCIRALPGRGIRVWGARTLKHGQYVNIRRSLLTLFRWVNQSFGDLVFEPSTPVLWGKIRGRLSSFCYDLFELGALNGLTAAEAFFVKCDAETNPPDEVEAGRVIAEVGLATIKPAEFIVVRIAHSAAGTMLVPPAEF